MHSKASLLFLILTATFRSAEVRKDWVHSSCLILWRRCKSYLLGTRAYLLASRCPQRSTAMALSIQRRRLRKYAMRYVLAKSTRHLMWRIRTLALMVGVVLVFGSPPVFARGGAHSGGHGGGPFRRAWWSLWWPKRASWRSCRQHAWTDYNGHNDAGSLHASESLPPTDQIWEDCPNSARSSGRRFQPKRPGTGSSPSLSSVALIWRKN